MAQITSMIGPWNQKRSKGKITQCDQIEYFCLGGEYTNTKYVWGCNVCGKVWFSREYALKCDHVHMKDDYGYQPVGYMITERMEKVCNILRRCKTEEEIIKMANLNKSAFMIYRIDKTIILRLIKEMFPSLCEYCHNPIASDQSMCCQGNEHWDKKWHTECFHAYQKEIAK
jgi:hypothetical protein